MANGGPRLRKRFVLFGLLAVLVIGIVVVRRVNNRLDEFGTCLGGEHAVTVYAANAGQDSAGRAVIFFVTVPTPPGGYDLSEYDGVSSDTVRAVDARLGAEDPVEEGAPWSYRCYQDAQCTSVATITSSSSESR